jgi:hypothetical protein
MKKDGSGYENLLFRKETLKSFLILSSKKEESSKRETWQAGNNMIPFRS